MLCLLYLAVFVGAGAGKKFLVQVGDKKIKTKAHNAKARFVNKDFLLRRYFFSEAEEDYSSPTCPKTQRIMKQTNRFTKTYHTVPSKCVATLKSGTFWDNVQFFNIS